MFYECLSEFRKTGEFIAVYSGSDKFIFGTVCGIDEEYFALKSYTPNGDNDGYIVKRIDSVTAVEHKSKYIEGLKRIIDAKKLLQPKNVVHSSIDFEKESLVETVLEVSSDENKVVSVELEDFETLIVGNVKSVDDPLCVIKQINEYGEPDGERIFPIEQINSVCIDTTDETKLNLLRQFYLMDKPLTDENDN